MNKFTKVLSGVLLGAMSATMVISTTAVAAPFGHHGFAHKKKLPVDKVKADLAVMILGSGDPAANARTITATGGVVPSGRAGSSFLIFADGVPVLMMDTGAGSFKSLALSGASISEVEAFIFTHLHLDHTSDMSGMVKSYIFHSLAARGPLLPNNNPEVRNTNLRPLDFFGPDDTTTNTTINPAGVSAANPEGAFEAMTNYVSGHYAGPRGLERYLNGFANAFFTPLGQRPGPRTGEPLVLNSTDLNINFDNPVIRKVTTLTNGLLVESIAVKHGPRGNFTPSVAYRITYKGKTIVWTGDTDSSGENINTISAGADVLIYDTAIAEVPTPRFLLQLHTTPTRIGEVVAAANPNVLVLAHLSGETEAIIPEILTTIRTQGYAGKIIVGKDLEVINVD